MVVTLRVGDRRAGRVVCPKAVVAAGRGAEAKVLTIMTNELKLQSA